MNELMTIFAAIGIGATVTGLMGTLYWLAGKYDMKKEERLRTMIRQEIGYCLLRAKNHTSKREDAEE